MDEFLIYIKGNWKDHVQNWILLKKIKIKWD